MRLFEAKRDILVMKKKLLSKGDKIKFEYDQTECNVTSIENPQLTIPISLDDISDIDFIEIEDPIKIKISERDSSQDEEVRNWRIQLDVKTTRSKLIEIENFMRETLESILT